MKILKYILLVVALLGAGSASRAEFRYGVQAGVNITDLSFKQDLFQIDQAVGPRVGVQGEMMFPGIGIGLRIGALYTMKGVTMDLGSRKIWAVDGYGKEHVYFHTLEIPVNLEFKWTRMNGLEDYIAPFVFGGPVFDFTLAHTSLKAFEFPFGSIGLRAGLGAEIFKRWQVAASYTWGMTYSTKAVKLENFSAQYRYWSVSATYFF